jgi:hypothetical protein
LLNDITLEHIAPNVNVAAIQAQTKALEAISNKMRFADFMYLLASALNHQITTNIQAPPSLTEHDLFP